MNLNTIDYNYRTIVNPEFAEACLTVDTPDEIEENPWKEHINKHVVKPINQLNITYDEPVTSYSFNTEGKYSVIKVRVNDKFIGTLINIE